MAISALDLFKIGVGPSSSHTMGPMLAGALFAERLAVSGGLEHVDGVRVELFGSLAATGIGHATDRAVVAGLMGMRPDTVDPDAMADRVAAVAHDAALPLCGTRPVGFSWGRDLQLVRDALPHHPNALRIVALDGRTRDGLLAVWEACDPASRAASAPTGCCPAGYGCGAALPSCTGT